MPTRLDLSDLFLLLKMAFALELGGNFHKGSCRFLKNSNRGLWNSDSKANFILFCHIQLILVGIFQIDNSL